MTFHPASALPFARALQAPPCRYARVLSIAGSDSGGGAGIQADLKTIAAHGCYGMTAITALTAQNTQGVRAVHPVPVAHLVQEIDAVADDIGVDAVKTGMLATPDVVLAVVAAIQRHGWTQVVVDPVMVATSGDMLMAEETVSVMVDALFPCATLVTPNLDEAECLLGQRITQVEQLLPAAQRLIGLGARAVLLKGGHLPGNEVVDLLLTADGEQLHLASPRVTSVNVHGTGCTLSSAIACQLALGQPLPQAVRAARSYILQAIEAGASVHTGRGHGPLNHGFAPLPMHRLAI